MNIYVELLKNELGKSPFELTDSNIKKIKRRLPVPTDYNIVWADIDSLNGYPSGIVITEQALVYKAPKELVRKKRKSNIDKAENKKEKRIAKQLKIIYRIIPWEYFDPKEFSFNLGTIGKLSYYYLESDETIQTAFKSKKLFDFLYNLKNEEVKRIRREEIICKKMQEETLNTAIFTADNTIFFEDTYMGAAYGEGNNKTGFGVYGEEASTKLDKLNGEDASVVGRDNAKHGPDKIVNGQAVQMKCYQNGTRSVNACFDDKTKLFKYYDNNGKPMQIEVPSDQYDDALKQLQNKISEGKVPGVTDPSEAVRIIRKSKLTTKQIHNLAKAGTFESLTYDAATGVVQCGAICGLSALVSFGISFWKTKDFKKSALTGLQTGWDVFGPTFASKILVSQLSRTAVASAINKGTTSLSKALPPKVRQEIINALRALVGKNPIYGAAAQKALAKALSDNIIVEGVTFFVFFGVNTVKYIRKQVSEAQWVKNMTSLIASILGTAGGSLATGTILSKYAKDLAKTTPGKILAAAGGMVVGMGAGAGASKVGNIIREDDAIISMRLFQACFINLCCDYLLNESEFNELNNLLDSKEYKKELQKFQSKLLMMENQYHEIEEFLTPLFKEVVSKRERIDHEIEEKFIEEMSNKIIEITEQGLKGA